MTNLSPLETKLLAALKLAAGLEPYIDLIAWYALAQLRVLEVAAAIGGRATMKPSVN